MPPLLSNRLTAVPPMLMSRRTLSVFLLAVSVASATTGATQQPTSRGELARMLARQATQPPIRALYVTGGGFHDFVALEAIVPPGIAARTNIVWTIDRSADTSTTALIARHRDTNWADQFDVVVYNMSFSWVVDPQWIERIAHAHRDKGVAAVVLHGATHSYRRSTTTAWKELMGASSMRHDAQRTFGIERVAPDHPIIKGLPKGWTPGRDELYDIERVWPGMTTLAQGWSVETEKHHPVAWTNTYGKAKVFVTPMGHNNHTMADPAYLDLVTRGLLWTLGKLEADGTPAAGYEAKSASTIPPAPQQDVAARDERFRRMGESAEQQGLAQPFRGIVIGGRPTPGLFPIRSTGVSTGPARSATEQFLAALTPAQRSKATFGVGDDEWRKWMNQHFYVRQGVGFNEMTEAQRDAAIGLLRASLSAKGLQTTRDIMRLNHTLAEINDNDFKQYGEWLYWITVMGTPSATEPWGWQLDGHHVVINYFVLGDQVVMTPTFMGSEPVTATSGKFAGTTVLRAEQDKGLALINALTAAQRAAAIIRPSKTGNENVGEAFKDNLDLTNTGVRGGQLSAPQREQLLGLVAEYVANMPRAHARVRMAEVRRHINDTWFSWIGGITPESVFYYRIQSPVILVEFDHQAPIALRGVPRGVPTRQHIHTVVRTPNGNDYGKDLLRQHYERHPHR